jgi:hypothetical protein
VTHWLGEGRDLVFSEFGLPSLLVEDDAAAAYTARALEGLRRAGCLGALLWCYSDYDPALSESPPFDLAPHERSFGLWRADGSPKPAVAAIAAFVGAERSPPDKTTNGSTSTGISSPRPGAQLPGSTAGIGAGQGAAGAGRR